MMRQQSDRLTPVELREIVICAAGLKVLLLPLIDGITNTGIEVEVGR